MLPSIVEYFRLTENQQRLLTRQQAAILLFIYRFGSITPMDAFNELDITKLSTRVSEMRSIGIEFDQAYESRVNRSGRTVHYMRYRKAAA